MSNLNNYLYILKQKIKQNIMGRNPNFVSSSINRHGSLIEKKVMTIAQQLGVTKFPFIIKDNQGNEIYFEDSKGWWSKREYDDKGNTIYWENSNGHIRHINEMADEKEKKVEKPTPPPTQIIQEGKDPKIQPKPQTDSRPKVVPEYTMAELVDKLGHNFKIKK